MKKYILLLSVLVFLSCHKKGERNLDSMEVLYYNTLFDRSVAISCNEIKSSPPKNDTLDYETLFIDYSGVLDTVILDTGILQKITISLDQRQIIKEDYVDTRMKCYFIYKDGKVDSLCIGNNPIYGIYNNEPVKLSNELVYLIRGNCGFYEWMGIDQMVYFDELNDSSFIRKKVKSRSGEKY